MNNFQNVPSYTFLLSRYTPVHSCYTSSTTPIVATPCLCYTANHSRPPECYKLVLAMQLIVICIKIHYCSSSHVTLAKTHTHTTSINTQNMGINIINKETIKDIPCSDDLHVLYSTAVARIKYIAYTFKTCCFSISRDCSLNRWFEITLQQ